jgi:5-formyltetrahydrofolate cyclo-ligase
LSCPCLPSIARRDTGILVFEEIPWPMIPEIETPPTSHSSKAALRRAMRATIAALDPRERWIQEDGLITRFCGLPGLNEAGSVLLFVAALPEEVRTLELFSLAYEMKKTVLCPRVDRRGRRLTIHRISDPASELIPGVLGIPEPRPDLPEVAPATIDWALVPGLAFDERGFRLGRGAGYYDRLLPLVRLDAICWALCLSCQVVCDLPVEAHDAPLDGVSSPERTVRGCRSSHYFRT